MTLTPAFDSVATWVRWIAQDADGTWWGYEHEPNEGDYGWYENEAGRTQRLADDTPNPGWRGTLRSSGTHAM